MDACYYPEMEQHRDRGLANLPIQDSLTPMIQLPSRAVDALFNALDRWFGEYRPMPCADIDLPAGMVEDLGHVRRS